MNKRYEGINTPDLHRQMQTLVVQSTQALATHQKATGALSVFEASYGNEEKIVIDCNAYRKTRKQLIQSAKLAKKQVRIISGEISRLTNHLDLLAEQ